MNLSFSPEEVAFREQLRDFFRTTVPATLRGAVLAGRKISKQQQIDSHRLLHAHGLAVPHWPKEWGGADWSPAQCYLCWQEMYAAGVPEPLQYNVSLLGPVLIAYGSEKQKRHFLPKLANLDLWFCQGFSEPGAGSDLASLRTTAQREGNHYIVNGQKMWTSGAHYADWMHALVRTNPNARKSQEGLSFLMIDLKTPGVTIRPIITIDRRHETNEVFLDNVMVPAENLIGEENKGWDYGKFLLTNERLNSAARHAGQAKGRLRMAKALATQLQAGGGGLIEDGQLRNKITAAEADHKAIEMLAMRVVDSFRRRDDGRPDPLFSILKIGGTELQQAVNELLLQIAGPDAARHVPETLCESLDVRDGFDWTASIAPMYFLNRVITIAAGSTEINKNILAKACLGL